MSEKKKTTKLYSDAYEAYCNSLISLLETKLARPLTSEEIRNIHNVGSMTMLEMFERSFQAVTDVEDLEIELLLLADQSEQRLQIILSGLPEALDESIRLRLTDEDLANLANMRDFLEIQKFLDEF